MMKRYRRFPVLQKPFSLSQLRGTLATVLSPNEVKYLAGIAAIPVWRGDQPPLASGSGHRPGPPKGSSTGRVYH